MRAAIASFAVLVLIGCSSESPEPSEIGADDIADSEEIRTPQRGEGVGSPDDIDAVLNDRIPAKFQGIWDDVEGSCDPLSDSRMEVGAGEILFYESVGIVTDVEPEGDAIIVTFAMEGEGETWEQSTRFALAGDGSDQRLLSSDAEQPDTFDEYASKRCET
jgi:hypothetical protein